MASRIVEETSECRRMIWPGSVPCSAVSSPPDDSAEGPEAGAGQRLQQRLEELEANLDRRVKESYEAGRAHGESAGRAQAEERLRDLLERLSHTIVELAQARVQIYKEAEPDLVKLSLEIARRILRRELTVDPAAVSSLIDSAVQKLHGQLVHKVRVHPDHADIVRASVQQLGAGADVQVIGDPSRERGTVIFELENGSLDASLETQLREIERGLSDQAGNAR